MRRLTTISLLVALLFLGLTATAAKLITSSGTAGKWSWGTAVPGDSIASQGVAASLAVSARASTAIDTSGARQLKVTAPLADRPGSGMTLLSAPASSGDPCFTFVSDEGATRQFSCIDAAPSQDSIFRFVGSGGTTIGTPTWVTVVGVVRDDVARLTVVTDGGKETQLPLNRWRAFEFRASSPSDFPRFLRSYNTEGALIEELATAA
jgi:hypothetical protein